MGTAIFRQTYSFSKALATSPGSSPAISLRGWAGGSVHIPTGTGVTTLTFHAATAVGGTYDVAYDGATAITMTVVAPGTYALPDQIFNWGAMKVGANAAKTVDFCLKG